MVLQNSGQISLSQIRNEFGGPVSLGSISLSQYKIGGLYNTQTASNPNNIPTNNTNISFSKFYSSAKWNYPLTAPYTTTQQANTQSGWNINNQDVNALQIWANGDPYQYTGNIGLINYGINFYYIFQNTTGSDISGTLYILQDDNANYYLNGTNIANYNYNGITNSLSATFKVGQNIFRGYVINGGGAGTFILTFKKSNGETIMYTNTNWRTDTRCLLHYYNWISNMTFYNGSGSGAIIQGGDPDKQVQLAYSAGSTRNIIYANMSIQNYSSFTLYFEIYISNTSEADALFFFVGSNSLSIYETGGYNSFLLDFQIYTGGGLSQGIYLRRGDGTIVASYITSGHIVSTWQGVYIFYTKGTTNTWNIYWNGINIFNYSDPNNASYISNAGSYYGAGFRDGGAVGSGWVRHFNLYHKV